MTRKATTLMTGTLLLLALSGAQAQDADSFMVGNRVRVTLQSGRPIAGRVLASDADTLTLLTGDQPLKVSRSRITAAEMSIDRRPSWLKGAAIGTGIGLVLGLVVPLDTNCSSSRRGAGVNVSVRF